MIFLKILFLFKIIYQRLLASVVTQSLAKHSLACVNKPHITVYISVRRRDWSNEMFSYRRPVVPFTNMD